MLQGLFNYDNPVWRFIGKLGDLILLNILWIICSIPVFTIGASTTAVFYVTLKLARDEDDSTIRSFFRSFKNNFKQATAIWLILLSAGLVLSVDFWFFISGQMALGGILKTVLTAVSGGMLLIYMFILTYVFPLQARFYNPVKRTIMNAFFMSVRHLLQTIGILVIDAGMVAASYFSLFYLPQASMLLMLFGMPLIAFVNSYFFTMIFKKYIPKEHEDKVHSDSTPMLGEEDEAMKKAIENLKSR